MNFNTKDGAGVQSVGNDMKYSCDSWSEEVRNQNRQIQSNFDTEPKTVQCKDKFDVKFLEFDWNKLE